MGMAVRLIDSTSRLRSQTATYDSIRLYNWIYNLIPTTP